MSPDDIREIENAKQKIIFLDESKKAVYKELSSRLNLNSTGKLFIHEFIFNHHDLKFEEFLEMVRQDGKELKTSPSCGHEFKPRCY